MSLVKRQIAWVLLLIAGVGILWLIAAEWNGFLYSDSCLDAGGTIESGACVGARRHIPTFLEAPWQLQAFTLLPSVAIGAVVVAVLAAANRRGW
jgi:hypothetical protein